MLPPEVVDALRRVDGVYDPTGDQEAETMIRNNLSQERRIMGHRTDEEVVRDTVSGIGAERVLLDSGIGFTRYAPVVEGGGAQLGLERLGADLVVAGRLVEVKTCSSKWSDWYVSRRQERSLRETSADVVILMERDEAGPPYRYRPRLIAAAKTVSKYLRHNRFGYSEYIFRHRAAEAAGDCIMLLDPLEE